MDHLFSETKNAIERPEPISVSEVSKKIHDVLDGRIGTIDVIGQVNSPKLGNHWYFTLTDGVSKIDCAMWASKVSSNANGLPSDSQGWKPEQGDQVIIRGSVGHYAKYGKTQMYVDRIKPVGDEKGKLQLEYEALLKEFRDAGWFDEQHKKLLPKYPKRIAIITSSSSAAVQDVIETTRRRMPSVELLVINASMQGDACVDDVTTAIQRVDASASSLGIDAIIVTRGGGSLEELWSFNHRRVVEAVFHCNTPIVAAIGHESDTSIIELVADHRASTPTQTVMVLVPDKDELLQFIEFSNSRLNSCVARMVDRCESVVLRLEQLAQSSLAASLHALSLRIASRSEFLATKRPHALVQARQKRTLNIQSSLSNAMQLCLTRLASSLGSMESRLESIGPMEVLRRGYSLTQDSSGKVIRSIKNVKEGEQLRTVLADGTIESTVECVHE